MKRPTYVEPTYLEILPPVEPINPPPSTKDVEANEPVQESECVPHVNQIILKSLHPSFQNRQSATVSSLYDAANIRKEKNEKEVSKVEYNSEIRGEDLDQCVTKENDMYSNFFQLKKPYTEKIIEPKQTFTKTAHVKASKPSFHENIEAKVSKEKIDFNKESKSIFTRADGILKHSKYPKNQQIRNRKIKPEKVFKIEDDSSESEIQTQFSKETRPKVDSNIERGSVEAVRNKPASGYEVITLEEGVIEVNEVEILNPLSLEEDKKLKNRCQDEIKINKMK